MNLPTEISKALASFKDDLRTQSFDENTIRQHSNYAGIYLEWLGKESIEVPKKRDTKTL